jgi:hypothetical protein
MLNDEELNNLHRTPSIVTTVKCRRFRWAGVGETRSVFRSLVDKLLYLRMYMTHFSDRNLPSKIWVRLIYGIKKRTYILRKKSVIQKTTEPMTPVLYVVKPPVETVSSRHRRLSIDSRKSEDRDITDKLP